ncbi:hypothetical protein AU467_05120 [Mesorhizobium loti]|uniref:Ubiquinone biosynthesis methyltransferase UbiE n=1 Tax=Rhizobium loti TaxID=381 RepID=A0A101KQW7_RHILI|nr:hypothetical protein AU467_05120 [Mesorhizobium loti]
MVQSASDACGAHFERLLQIDMDVDVFSSNWSYCDRVSSYVARMIGHNRTDSLLYSNLLSSALNELLETVFRVHRPGGSFACSVSRLGKRDRIELIIPCDAAGARFYRDAMNRLQQDDVETQYRSALFAEGPLDPDIGLFELAVDYAATMSVEQVGKDAIRLVADLSLEETRR